MSEIIICDDFDEVYQELVQKYAPLRCIPFIEDDFLIEHAKAVLAEAYISEAQTKYLILGAKSYTTISQNSLLKVLEEPPHNIEFILLSESKSALLPTIRSRMPLRYIGEKREKLTLDISFKNFDINRLFLFVKEHERLKKHEAKELLEVLFTQASTQLILNKNQLQSFDDGYRLIDLNGKFQTILVMILMNLITNKKRNK
jgi:DNA polymerase-3 subunit delta'